MPAAYVAFLRRHIVYIQLSAIVILIICIINKERLPLSGSMMTESVQEVKRVPEVPSTNLDIFKPHEEPWASEDKSFVKEFERFQLYIHSLEVKCRCLRPMGGHYVYFPSSLTSFWDGQYTVCIDEELIDPDDCLVYSAGIKDDWSFDEAMAKFGCEIYSMDPNIGLQDHLHSENVHFLNFGVSDKDSPGNRSIQTNSKSWRTLNGLVKELGHEKRIIDVLKIDIEGGEYSVLPSWLKDGSLRSRVVQFHMEIHGVGNDPKYMPQKIPSTLDKLHTGYLILKWMELQGFKIFTQRQNELTHRAHDLGFINTFLVQRDQ